MHSISAVSRLPLYIAGSNQLQKKEYGMSETSPTVPAKDTHEHDQLEKPTAPDKPLPSLPVATVSRRSPIVRRSLIDASEKPLRKSLSPSPGEKAEEEWPTLSPSRPTTPNTTPEMARGVSSSQTENSTANRSAPKPQFAHFKHQPEVTAVETQMLRQGSPEDVASTQQRNDTVTAVSHTPVEEAANDHGPSSELASTGIVPKNELVPSAVGKSAHVDSSSPLVQHALTLKSDAKLRASRLPKRLSTPGPVRSSNSPQRFASRTPSPYKSISDNVQQSLPSKHDHLSSSVSKPAGRAKVHPVGHTVDVVDITTQVSPSLIAIKQSYKSGHHGSRRSSIPRPRHKFQLRQDAESETEVVVTKLPKEKRSKRLSTDHRSDDGDLDTDGAPDDDDENKKAPWGSNLADDKKSGQSIETGKARMHLKADTASSRVTEESAPPITIDSHSGRDHSSATVGKHQADSLLAANSMFAEGIHSNVGRQRQTSDMPYDRFKRLSVTAPEHGPILRISDSADKIIMGYDFEQDTDDDDASARKHNSVPDLRRSVAVKELRKSAEGLGKLPLSRSTTMGSLAKHEGKVQVTGTNNAGELSDSPSEPPSGTTQAEIPISDDPFSPFDDKKQTIAHKIARKPTPNGWLDWPLKSLPQSSTELRPVNENLSEEGESWISPLQAGQTAVVPEQKPMPTCSVGRGSKFMAADSAGSASKKQHFESSQRPTRGDVSSVAVEKSSVPAKHNSVRSPVQINAHFPPRTSSRTHTPDVSVRSHAQIKYFSNREIPNRFESTHPRRLCCSRGRSFDGSFVEQAFDVREHAPCTRKLWLISLSGSRSRSLRLCRVF